MCVQVLRTLFTEYTNRLEGRARKYHRSDKYAKVMGMALFARAHFWEQPDLSQPKGAYLFSASTFEGACRGLVVQKAVKLNRSRPAGSWHGPQPLVASASSAFKRLFGGGVKPGSAGGASFPELPPLPA